MYPWFMCAVEGHFSNKAFILVSYNGVFVVFLCIGDQIGPIKLKNWDISLLKAQMLCTPLNEDGLLTSP